MSHYDYQASKQIAATDPPFAALIMAAYRKADTHNTIYLEQAFPDICRELRQRYESPPMNSEKQFLVCRNCGEAFDSITPAHEHGTADLSGSAGWCGDEGFNIVPESEAM